jgi:propanediol dehydratase small subunit
MGTTRDLQAHRIVAELCHAQASAWRDLGRWKVAVTAEQFAKGAPKA